MFDFPLFFLFCLLPTPHSRVLWFLVLSTSVSFSGHLGLVEFIKYGLSSQRDHRVKSRSKESSFGVFADRVFVPTACGPSSFWTAGIALQHSPLYTWQGYRSMASLTWLLTITAWSPGLYVLSVQD